MQDGDGLQKYGKKNKSMSFKGLLTNIAQSKMADISKMAKSGNWILCQFTKQGRRKVWKSGCASSN